MLRLTVIACTTDELSESWQIDRLRVLAVAAEPAEPRPGDTVTFSSLVVSPGVDVAATVWFACLFGDDEYGCEVDPSLLGSLEDTTKLDEDTLDALYDAGFIGAEPYLPPVWQVPTDALADLSEDERQEGLTALINVTAIPDQDEITEDDLELAFKRVPVSEAKTPNHNPVIANVTVDAFEVAEGSTVSVDRGLPYTLGVTLTDDSVEPYTYVTEDGVAEDREEEPYFTWYAEHGSFEQTSSLWPYTTVTWYPPTDRTVDAGSLWVVVRDRRGGMAWSRVDVAYR